MTLDLMRLIDSPSFSTLADALAFFGDEAQSVSVPRQ